MPTVEVWPARFFSTSPSREAGSTWSGTCATTASRCSARPGTGRRSTSSSARARISSSRRALELCRTLREGEPGRTWDRNVPVIVVTQPSSDPVDRVRALERGADDVAPAPVAYLELVARIRAILAPDDGRRGRADRGRRHRRRPPHPSRARPRDTRRASRAGVRAGGAPRGRSRTRVWTKGELLRDVWGFRSDGLTRTVDSHACRLRRKLRLADGDRFVVNVWGVGYRLLE